MSKFSEVVGSFRRNGNFPLEANYIFSTELELKDFYSDPINKTTLHTGLLKVVGEGDRLALYWVVKDGENLKFKKLLLNIDVETLYSDITSLRDRIEEESNERKETDASHQDLIDALDLAVTELEKNTKNNTEAVKAIAGTEQDNIPEYLATLDYLSLTEISEVLANFLNGYDLSNPILETLETLKTSILGLPNPTDKFSNLREIEDTIRTMQTYTANALHNLQTELDLTLVGVGLSGDGAYNSDKETYYLLDATSVMNALKTLDALVYQAITTGGGVTEEEVNAIVQKVVGAAPEALDTLKELADALDNDANFAGTVTNKFTEINERISTQDETLDSIMEILNDLYYRVSMSLSANTIEKGENTPVTVNWNSYFNNLETVSTFVLKKNDVVVDNPSKPYTITINDTTKFTVEGTRNGVTKTTSLTVNAYYPKYYGGSTVTTMDANTLLSLSKQSISGSATSSPTITSLDNEYIWFCIPAGMNISKVTLGGFNVPLEAVLTVVVTGKGNYKCYRTTNPLSAGTRQFVIS